MIFQRGGKVILTSPLALFKHLLVAVGGTAVGKALGGTPVSRSPESGRHSNHCTRC